jgi:hypothetical protein
MAAQGSRRDVMRFRRESTGWRTERPTRDVPRLIADGEEIPCSVVRRIPRGSVVASSLLRGSGNDSQQRDIEGTRRRLHETSSETPRFGHVIGMRVEPSTRSRMQRPRYVTSPMSCKFGCLPIIYVIFAPIASGLHIPLSSVGQTKRQTSRERGTQSHGTL